MIPRIQPAFTISELWAALRADAGTVHRFEAALARHFNMRHAFAFPYGRTALYCCLRALNCPGGEVVQPAYNCVVMAHATVKAGYRPVFVDVEADRPNQDPERMLAAIGPRTVAVLPVSLFGFAFDAAALCSAIRARRRETLIVLDSCLAFDAAWNGERMAAQADAAVLAFGNEKPVVSLLGGALLTNRDDLAAAVRRYRDTTFRRATSAVVRRRWVYFASSWLAYSNSGAEIAAWLKSRIAPVGRYVQSWRERETIQLPPDNDVHMLPMAAGIGCAQLARAAHLIGRRREIGAMYNRELANIPGLRVLQWPESSTYAIYAARVPDAGAREHTVTALRRLGVQADSVWSYVVPALDCYRAEGYSGDAFPNATEWAESVINLPSHPTMTNREVVRVVAAVRRVFSDERYRG